MSDIISVLSESWAYTIFRIICLPVGIVGFLIAWFKGMHCYFFRAGRGFLKWLLIGFAFGLLGWGAPMFVGMEYDLSECETNTLIMGKLANCELS